MACDPKFPVVLDPSVTVSSTATTESVFKADGSQYSSGVVWQGFNLVTIGVDPSNSAGPLSRGVFQYPLPPGINSSWITEAHWQYRDGVYGTSSPLGNSQLKVKLSHLERLHTPRR